MRRIALSIAIVASSLVRPLDAQHPAKVDFGPLETLVGHCWGGTFPDGKVTDKHCFEWVHDRKFIRDRHVVSGGEPYQGETIYAWDAAAKQLSYTYWNSAGMVIVGRVEFTPDGVVFPSHYSTPKGEVELKAVWTNLSEKGYRVTQSQRTDGAWKDLWSMDLTSRP